jgi:hypothetical protein
LYTLAWEDADATDDPLLQLTIKYREHDEVEIKDDADD